MFCSQFHAEMKLFVWPSIVSCVFPQSENTFLQAELDGEEANSEFDLNSLIEGDVDDDDFGETFNDEAKEEEPERVTYFEPLKVSGECIAFNLNALTNNPEKFISNCDGV